MFLNFKKIAFLSLDNITNDTKYLSFGFGLIFFSYSSIAQYLSLYYLGIGSQNTGLISIMLIYMAFGIASFFSPTLVTRFGIKRSMIVSSIVYLIFGISILLKNISLLYLSSVFIGIFASALWTSQWIYILQSTDKDNVTANGGYFFSIYSLLMTIGVVCMNIFIHLFSYETSFILIMTWWCIAPFVLCKLKNITITQNSTVIELDQIKALLQDKILWKFFLLCFLVYIIQGFVIWQLPLFLKTQFGENYLKMIIPLFYVIPFIISFPSGKIVDKFGTIPLIISSTSTIFFSTLAILYVPYIPVQTLGFVFLAISLAILQPIIQSLPQKIVSIEKLKNLVGMRFFFLSIGNIIGICVPMIASTETLYFLIILIALLSTYIFIRAQRTNVRSTKDMTMKYILF